MKAPLFLWRPRPFYVSSAVAAAAVYVVEAAAWPVQRGRDLWDYLAYWLSLGDGATPFPMVMLVRSPGAPVLLGPAAELGGATGLEVLCGALFVVWVLAWGAFGRTWSPWAGLASVVAVLAVTPLAIPFHEPSGDAIVAAGFALFAAGLARTLERPSPGRYAALGAGVAYLALTRPSYLVLAAAVVLPLAARGGVRGRLLHASAFLIAALLPLGAWAVHNGVRYDDYTVSRSGALNVPFYTAWLAGGPRPDAGPASRRLAALVEAEVLPLPPYRRLGVDVDTYFASRKNYEVVRLAGLVDRVKGTASDYRLLREAAREIPGGRWVWGVDVAASARAVRSWLGRPAGFEFRTKPDAWPTPGATIDIGGRPFPNPAALPPAPDAVPYGFLACASDEIARCLVADPGAQFGGRGLSERYRSITRTVARWDEGLGARAPRTPFVRVLDRAHSLMPPSWVWLAVAALALAWRRPRGTRALIAVGVLALLVLAVHAIGGRPDPLYALPVLGAFPVAAVCALLAPRVPVRRPVGGVSPTPTGRGHIVS